MTVTEATEVQTMVLPETADPSQVAPKDARQLSKLFFDRLAVLEEGTPEYQYVRTTLIGRNLTLVRLGRAPSTRELSELMSLSEHAGCVDSSARSFCTRPDESTTKITLTTPSIFLPRIAAGNSGEVWKTARGFWSISSRPNWLMKSCSVSPAWPVLPM